MNQAVHQCDNYIKVKNFLMMDMFIANMQLFPSQNILDGLKSCGLLMGYYDTK